MATFAENTENKNQISDEMFGKGFASCDGDGLSMTSANFNSVLEKITLLVDGNTNDIAENLEKIRHNLELIESNSQQIEEHNNAITEINQAIDSINQKLQDLDLDQAKLSYDSKNKRFKLHNEDGSESYITKENVKNMLAGEYATQEDINAAINALDVCELGKNCGWGNTTVTPSDPSKPDSKPDKEEPKDVRDHLGYHANRSFVTDKTFATFEEAREFADTSKCYALAFEVVKKNANEFHKNSPFTQKCQYLYKDEEIHDTRPDPYQQSDGRWAIGVTALVYHDF